MISGLLLGLGSNLISNLVEGHGEELVAKGIEKVTGIKLDGKAELTAEEKAIIISKQYDLAELDFKELKVILGDRKDARSRDVNLMSSKDWLVRNMGSMIAGLTVICTFMLDAYILYKGISVGVTALNPIVTLIAGAMTTRVMTIYNFYYGANKIEADKQRI